MTPAISQKWQLQIKKINLIVLALVVDVNANLLIKREKFDWVIVGGTNVSQ